MSRATLPDYYSYEPQFLAIHNTPPRQGAAPSVVLLSGVSWSPTALQPWSLLYLRRNPPKRVLLRQGFGGHPLRIPPQLYSCGFLRRRVNGSMNVRAEVWFSRGPL